MKFTLIKDKAGECVRCAENGYKGEENHHSELYSDHDEDGWCWECTEQEYDDIADDQHFASEDDDMDSMFADPGGNSALRAVTEYNPRNQSCPTCHTENVLTPADVALFYQCDRCANELERGY